MKLANAIERFSENRLQVNLFSAAAAGLCAGMFSSLFHALDYPVNPSLYARYLIVAGFAYLTVAFLLPLVGKSLLRVVPSWFMIAFVGSALFIVLDLAPAVIRGWAYFKIEQSFVKYFSNELYAAGVVIVFFILITMPITALIYYAADIVKAARAWHNGPEKLNIFGGPRIRR